MQTGGEYPCIQGQLNLSSINLGRWIPVEIHTQSTLPHTHTDGNTHTGSVFESSCFCHCTLSSYGQINSEDMICNWPPGPPDSDYKRLTCIFAYTHLFIQYWTSTECWCGTYTFTQPVWFNRALTRKFFHFVRHILLRCKIKLAIRCFIFILIICGWIIFI